jgi:hypothetical protein
MRDESCLMICLKPTNAYRKRESCWLLPHVPHHKEGPRARIQSLMHRARKNPRQAGRLTAQGRRSAMAGLHPSCRRVNNNKRHSVAAVPAALACRASRVPASNTQDARTQTHVHRACTHLHSADMMIHTCTTESDGENMGTELRTNQLQNQCVGWGSPTGGAACALLRVR